MEFFNIITGIYKYIVYIRSRGSIVYPTAVWISRALILSEKTNEMSRTRSRCEREYNEADNAEL